MIIVIKQAPGKDKKKAALAATSPTDHLITWLAKSSRKNEDDLIRPNKISAPK